MWAAIRRAAREHAQALITCSLRRPIGRVRAVVRAKAGAGSTGQVDAARVRRGRRLGRVASRGGVPPAIRVGGAGGIRGGFTGS